MDRSSIVSVYLDLSHDEYSVNMITARNLYDICMEIEQDRSVRCVIISGTGKNYFCVGIGTELSNNPSPWSKLSSSIAELTVPVIAAINGNASDAGLEIILACDIRIAADNACFGFPGILDGKLPFNGGTQRLPRIVGKGHAMELLLTGELINATQALQIGLVDEVVPLSRLMKRTVELAGMISGKAPVAVRFAKEAVNASSNLPLSEGLRLEGDLYLLLQTTRDRSEGVSAFLNKRKPMFHGD